jgi:hypothetical protein
MTLTAKKLNRMCKSMRVCITKEQQCAILEMFGTEPEPYEWSEWEVAEGIRSFIYSYMLLDGVPF